MPIEHVDDSTVVHVGQLLELTREEVQQLNELTYEAYRAVSGQKPSWLQRYAVAMNGCRRIMKAALDRSHTGAS